MIIYMRLFVLLRIYQTLSLKYTMTNNSFVKIIPSVHFVELIWSIVLTPDSQNNSLSTGSSSYKWRCVRVFKAPDTEKKNRLHALHANGIFLFKRVPNEMKAIQFTSQRKSYFHSPLFINKLYFLLQAIFFLLGIKNNHNLNMLKVRIPQQYRLWLILLLSLS
jgi:hypothetical protein